MRLRFFDSLPSYFCRISIEHYTLSRIALSRIAVWVQKICMAFTIDESPTHSPVSSAHQAPTAVPVRASSSHLNLGDVIDLRLGKIPDFGLLEDPEGTQNVLSSSNPGTTTTNTSSYWSESPEKAKIKAVFLSLSSEKQIEFLRDIYNSIHDKSQTETS
jgi:hypothetical protein